MAFLLLSTFILPLIVCVVLNLVKFKEISLKYIIITIVAGVNLILAVINAKVNNTSFTILKLSQDMAITFGIDGISNIFAILINTMFLIVAIYSIGYVKKEKNEKIYSTAFLLSLSALNILCYSKNLVTMYLCFEMVSIFSMPLVLVNMDKPAINATLKYLFYSLGGAFLGLLGVFFIEYAAISHEFVLGGVGLNLNGISKDLFLAVLLIAIIGYGAKAGMFPLHGWLPSAHPIAPAPASALLSGVVAKAGVVAIIRVVYYTVGVDFIKGTWMQIVWIILALLTVLMGSYMAFVQNIFKRRLAYSTVSQISYAIFGLSLCTIEGLEGALLQVIAHAMIKIALFLYAGCVIYVYDYHDVDELGAIGKKMPISTWCYTIASMGLVGIPFTAGFMSKWYLAIGSIHSQVSLLSYIGPIVLLISAILTAAYLFPIVVKGFFVGESKALYAKKEAPISMQIALIILAVLIIVVGVFVNPIINYMQSFLI